MVTYETFSTQVPAIALSQGGHRIFVTSLAAGTINRLSEVEHYDPALPADHPRQGYQRAPMRAHAQKIRSFLLDPTFDKMMPTATLLASRSPLNFQPSDSAGIGILELTKPIYLVDGQHRNLGFQMAASEDDAFLHFELPVIVIEVSDKIQEVRQFYNINKTAKGVKSDLAETLLKQLGVFAVPAKAWKGIAIEVAESLNGASGGPWEGRITLPNQTTRVVSQKSMTDSLAPIVRGALSQVQPEGVFKAVNNFWSALRSVMPEAFELPKNYVIQKSVGVFVWHEVASEFFRQQMSSDKDLSQRPAQQLLLQLDEYVDASFWANKKNGGIAPNYSGLGGMATLAAEIIAAFPQESKNLASDIRF